jgi:hypothetical protein
MLAYYGILELADSHCFRIEASIKSGFYVLFAGTLLLAILSSFVHKASLQYFYDIEAAKKLVALDNRLSPEEALAPVDNKFYKAISPPPVLFTDTFRWALRHEHLGDRPVNGVILEDTRERVLQGKEDDNVSIASLPSYIDVHEVDGIRCLEC